jgi:hypothetical protein
MAHSVFAFTGCVTIVPISLAAKGASVAGRAVSKAAASGGAILVDFAVLDAVYHR